MMIAFALAAAALSPDAAIGRWKSTSKNAVIEIAHCGPSICGRLLSSDGIRANPNLTDSKNKDAALRTRKLAGIGMLSGFVRGEGEWTGGKVYNAEDGGTYNGTITPLDADHIRLKGCIVWPLCKSQTWTRVR